MNLINYPSIRYFTDRDEQKAAFDQLWHADALPLILFSGLSGTGKSTLIDWLIVNKCQPENIPSVKIDLLGGLEPKLLFDSLIRLFPSAAQERFRKAAEAAQQNYHQQQQAIWQANAAHPIIAKQEAVGQGQINQAEIHIHTGQADAVANLTKIYQEQLTAAFQAERAHLPPGSAVIFLDTYEWVQDTSSREQIAWLWQVLLACCDAAPGLRVVVGSRVDIACEMAQKWRDHQPLDAYNRQDSDAFLHSQNPKMPSDVQAEIFALAQGHPLLTEMAAQLWQEGERAHNPLTSAELKQRLHDRSAEAWLYGRIINRLEELGERQVAAACRYGPLLRQLTRARLNAILPEDIPPFTESDFRRLTQFAFIKLTEHGWAFHKLMRDVQLAYLARQEDPEVRRCHQRAVAYFAKRNAEG